MDQVEPPPTANGQSSKIPQVTAEEKSALRQGIHEAARLSWHFLLMNFLASVVASYGLLANNTATVIGAMVIATFMGAISGMALAICENDIPLLRRASWAAFVGMLLILFVSISIGRLHLQMPLTPEILSRTHPGIIDIFIALAGGAAGAIATVTPRVSVGLVGVAIATALVPPLAASGICLSRGEWHMALGAFELFGANFIAIQFAYSTVLWCAGFRDEEIHQTSIWTFIKRNSVGLVLLGILSSLLAVNFTTSVKIALLEKSIHDHISQNLKQVPAADLLEIKFNHLRPNLTNVTVVVITPSTLTQEVRKVLQSDLPATERRVTLKTLYLLSTTFEREALVEGSNK